MTIITIPDKVLYKKAKKVKDFGNDLQIIIEKMIETMKKERGTGIAANQIGILLSLIIVEHEEKLYVIANPEIIKESEEKEIDVEACLSVPNFYGNVLRSKSISIKGKNRYGKPVKIKADNFLARIFQHEIDHINGILFIKKAETIWISDKNVYNK